MKYIALIVLLVLFSSAPVYAHPGNTASDGCHFCRTNCDKWGVSWNERHCHGSPKIETAPPVQENSSTNVVPAGPTPTKKPYRISTPKPTRTPTPTMTPTPTPTVAPTLTPKPTKSQQISESAAPQKSTSFVEWIMSLFGI